MTTLIVFCVNLSFKVSYKIQNEEIKARKLCVTGNDNCATKLEKIHKFRDQYSGKNTVLFTALQALYVTEGLIGDSVYSMNSVYNVICVSQLNCHKSEQFQVQFCAVKDIPDIATEHNTNSNV